jgi:hypothetical protein
VALFFYRSTLFLVSHRTNAVKFSDLLNKLQIYSHSVGKLKSLYEYLLGKHIHKLVRKSVPYSYSPSVEIWVRMLDSLHQVYDFGKPRSFSF